MARRGRRRAASGRSRGLAGVGGGATIAALAARIHDGLAIDAPPAMQWTWPDKPTDGWTRRPALWRDVIAALETPPPTTTTPRFIHGDLHMMNLLWSTRGRLTGVVDWSMAMHGQPARDLGHCRLNLAWLAGPALAEQLREAWEAETGWTLDPWWDLHALAAWGPGWLHFLPRQVGPRVQVDWDGATERVESLVELVLRRLG